VRPAEGAQLRNGWHLPGAEVWLVAAWCTDQACGRSRPNPIRAQAMRT
jgi:hypothetical protein